MTPVPKLRVLIADDHALMRDGLKAFLAMASDIEVVAEASDGRAALRLIVEAGPDLVLMDVGMPGLNGIEAVRILRRRGIDTRVIVLSMHSGAEYVSRAFGAGANGYVLKESAGTELLKAIRSVQAGDRYLSPALRHLTLHPGFSEAQSEDPLSKLSMRERQVLQLAAEGKSSVEIAGIVHLSPKSVETYRSRIMKKLALPDRTALVRFALKHGVTTLE